MNLMKSMSIVVALAMMTKAEEPINWKTTQIANDTDQISFVIGLKQFVDHTDFVHRHTPGHQMHHNGVFKTKKEAREFASQHMGPCQELVLNFAKSHEIEMKSLSEFNDYYEATASVEKLSQLFGSDMYEYTQGNRTLIRLHHNHTSGAEALPVEIQNCVSYWGRVWDFPFAKPIRADTFASGRKLRSLSTCPSNNICPSTIQSMYGLPDESSSRPSPKIKQLVFEFASASDQQGRSFASKYSSVDLELYLSSYGLNMNSFTSILGGGGEGLCMANDPACAEPNLDTQLMLATNTFNSPTEQNLYLNFEDTADMLQKVTSMDWYGIAAVSYSYNGDEDESDKQICHEMKLLADQGVTVLVSTGDQGANKGRCSEAGGCEYVPQRISNCPYVTAVGGTNGFEAGTEVGATTKDGQCGITSGGGFSAVFTSDEYDLSWQESATKSYIDSHMYQPVGGLTAAQNPKASKGRAYPDISAAACNFNIIVGGLEAVYSGTSGSAPILAGIVSMIAMRNGRTFGWINPTLYQNPNIFYDVTQGSNYCGNDPSQCYVNANNEVYGYFASAGWDPVTGLGSLGAANAFNALESALMQLPPLTHAPTTTAAPSSSSSLSVGLAGLIMTTLMVNH